MPVTFQQHTLPNGLTIIAEVDPRAHSAAAGFFVRTGARDEAGEVMGVSHFLEHMMFKGTDGLSAEALNQRFDAMGAKNNAYTSNELTCFYAHVLPEALPDCLDLLGTMMRPALRQKDFDTEKGVILEEIAMYEDNPFWLLYEATVDRHFAPHPLAHRVLGTRASITNLQRDQMQAYFDARYAADNTVVALAGNLDFQKSCAQLEKLCGWWQRTDVSRDSTEPRVGGGEFTLRNAKVNRGYVLALCRSAPFADERRYAAALASQVLGMHDNSRLHWALIEPGIAEEAQAQADPHDGMGQLFIYASGDPDKLDEIWSVCLREMRGLASTIAQRDIDLLLAKSVTGATIAGERPHDRMHRLGRQWTYLREYSPLEAELERLSKVTLDDVRACLRDFPMEPATVGKLVPG